jgi:quinolinate synthase
MRKAGKEMLNQQRAQMTEKNINQLVDKINSLKKKKNAVILVHNYQWPEIYRVADFIGDSFGLSKKATETKVKFIVFCGVDFMAESAFILNPEKTVLIPTEEAKCPMAAMVTLDELRELKAKHPRAAVVAYVNTTAEIKAESDICCTSANAVKVVNSLRQKEVIFVPDENLAKYVQRCSDKKIIPWKGWCYVHSRFTAKGLKEAKRLHPEAKVVVHPECMPAVIDLADAVCSTTGIITYVKNSPCKEFIIATEIGIIERLKLEAPNKTCYQAPPGGTCIQMKKNNLQLVLESLEKEQFRVTVPEDIRVKAKQALDKMLNVD